MATEEEEAPVTVQDVTDSEHEQEAESEAEDTESDVEHPEPLPPKAKPKKLAKPRGPNMCRLGGKGCGKTVKECTCPTRKKPKQKSPKRERPPETVNHAPSKKRVKRQQKLKDLLEKLVVLAAEQVKEAKVLGKLRRDHETKQARLTKMMLTCLKKTSGI